MEEENNRLVHRFSRVSPNVQINHLSLPTNGYCQIKPTLIETTESPFVAFSSDFHRIEADVESSILQSLVYPLFLPKQIFR